MFGLLPYPNFCSFSSESTFYKSYIFFHHVLDSSKNAPPPKVWLITGCSTGFGRELALAALQHGDTVVATDRNATNISDLQARGALAHDLDVTASDATLAAAILAQTARIDILVKNAGYVLAGAVEECSREEIQAQFATNVFGPANVLHAGVVANFGSIGGYRGSPAIGVYRASKAGVAMLSDSLRREVAHLGIGVTCVEPGYFRTGLLRAGARARAQARIRELEAGTEGMLGRLEAVDGSQPGDPRKGARVLVEALTGTGRCEGSELPARLWLGSDAYTIVNGYLDETRAGIERWKDVTTTTDFD